MTSEESSSKYDAAAFGDQKTTKISYFDPFGVFPELNQDLLARLPLVNLHWNPTGRPLRSIPTLDVDLVEEHAESGGVVPHQMLGLSDAPYLKIMFVKCEDNDTYRSSVRKMIREWLSKNVIVLRDPTEWLVIHYVPPGTKSYAGNRFRSGVFDKIRNDFNSGSKKDRCIQIRKDSGVTELETMETWSDAMTRIKDGVLEAFSKRVALYQEEIEKLNTQKDVMGWNFGTFFVMKEGLALAFENINLFEDALIIYDQLETAFSEILNHKSATFVSSVGFDNDTNESTSSLLRLGDDKTIRHQIMANNISLFDFQCYLFARQASLLLYISKASSSASISALKIGEIYARLRLFVSEMEGLLVSNKKNRLLIAEWSYNVVKDFLKASESLPDGISKEASEGRGEMFLLCRKALETLGMSKKYYIEGILADVSLEEADDDDNNEDNVNKSNNENKPTTTIIEIIVNRNPELKQGLKDKPSFYGKYRELTLSASAEFDLADRVRTLNRLSAQLALLDYQLQDYQAAALSLEAIPSIYSRQGWDSASSYLLSIYVKCLTKLGDKGGGDTLFIYSLELLRRYKYLMRSEIEELIENIDKLAAGPVPPSCPAIIEHPLEDWIAVKVLPSINPDPSSQGTYVISVEVKSNFNVEKDLTFDYATLVLVKTDQGERETLTLRVEAPTIGYSKKSAIGFSTNRFIQGKFKIDSLKFIKKRLALVKGIADDPIHSGLLLEFYPSPDFLWASLRLASSFTLTKRKVTLEINTKDELQSLKVRLKAAIPDIKLHLADGTTTMKATSTTGITAIPSKYMQPSLTIAQVDAGSVLYVNIPFSSTENGLSLIPIRITMDYVTAHGTFQHSFKQELDVRLSIDINVFDFFKSSRLFTKFSISCKDKLQPVKIEKVALGNSEHYTTSTPKSPGSITAYPGNPISYAFAISQKEDKSNSIPTNENLMLSVRHRYLRDGKF